LYLNSGGKNMNKYLAYFCVTTIMTIVGAVLFGLIGLAMDVSLNLLNGWPMDYGHAAIFAMSGGMMFALSVYVENPIAIIFNKLYSEAKEENK
jgi:hypothetical protein